MNKFLQAFLLLTLFSHHAWAKRVHMVHMTRRFILVVPDNDNKAPRPLVVLLHGCKQNPSIILEGTQMEKEADKNNFLVLVPEQTNFNNIDHCWNWFLSYEQKRFVGNEMGQIVSAIETITRSQAVDKDKIYVTGMSAGGVMAHNLSVCYPDVFAGSAIHSGLNYKVAENMSEAQSVLTSYEQKSPSYLGNKMYACSRNASQHRLNKVLIIHGEQDSRVPMLHSELISESQAVWRDYSDDGKENNSVIGTRSIKNIKFTNAYEVEKTETLYPGFTERKLIVKNLGHAWGGGKPVSVNFDPKAPSSNQFILEFFGLVK